MRVLGIDSSLTNYGWVVLDEGESVLARGRFSTKAGDVFLSRYVHLRHSIGEVICQFGITRAGLESPIFGELYSEGMYGLFLFTCEALAQHGVDTVLFSPLQVKIPARVFLNRPQGWKMQKPDMAEAARKSIGIRSINHNEADAYWVAKLAKRFWSLHDGVIQEHELAPHEKALFTEVKRKGATALIQREDDRFFLWSKTKGVLTHGTT